MEENIVMNETKQFIVIKLGNEQFGIDIKYIDNIVRMQRITRVPMAQDYFKGVINLRGEVIPVMSLRVRFDLEDDEIDSKTRIIIIKMDSQSKVGVLVDQVKEVVTIESDAIEKVGHKSADASGQDLDGVGKNGDELITLLNISSVISD